MSDRLSEQIIFQPLSHAYGRGVFCCGNDELDEWFWKHAWKRHESLSARVTTIHAQDGSLVGFYALAIALLRTSELSRYHRDSRAYGPYFPCLEFQYLAIDQKYQGNGRGTIAIGRVVDIFADMALNCGIPLLVMRAADQRVYAHYQKLGFVPYARPEDRRLLLEAQSAIALKERNQAR